MQEILKGLLAKYVENSSYSELTRDLRKDGFGEFVDAIDKDPQLMELLAELRREYSGDELDDTEYGIIPVDAPSARGIPVEHHGKIKFDSQACLKSCRGNCCKNRNYLMISMPDIYRIVSSKSASFLGIHSTRDLFDRKPPLVELIFGLMARNCGLRRSA